MNGMDADGRVTFPSPRAIGTLTRVTEVAGDMGTEAGLDLASSVRRLHELSVHMFAGAGDAFVSFDRSGTITVWNDAAEALFGWRRDEVAGRTLSDVIIPVQYRGAYVDALEGFLATGDGAIVGRHEEIAALHRDGNWLPVDLHIWASHDGGGPVFNVLAVDARSRGATLCCAGSIVESSSEAIVGTDLDGRILTWNRAAEQLYGYMPSEVLGKPFSLLVPPEHREDASRIFSTAGRGELVDHHETVRVRKDGSRVDVSVNISPIHDPTGAVVGVSTLARDVTEQRQMMLALQQAHEALEVALYEASASEARSRRFLADAAHQLRTPIAGIRACAEGLLRGASADERDRLLADTVRETSRAARLMTALLRMARLDAGEDLAIVPCDLVALCSHEVSRARALAPDLDITVRRDEESGVLPELDDGTVREILSNLLDNARRHAATRIEVVVRTSAERAEVEVHDDGPGMAPGDVERAFERFVSLDGRGGSGLGLPIARGMARAQGGDLTYERPAFVLRLPAVAVKSRTVSSAS